MYPCEMIPDMLFDDQELQFVYTFSLSRIGPYFEVIRLGDKKFHVKRTEVVIRKDSIPRLGMTPEKFSEKLTELEQLKLVSVTHGETYFLVHFLRINMPPSPLNSEMDRSDHQLTPISFKEFGERYITHLTNNAYADKTIENAERVVKIFGDFKGTALLHTLQPLDLEHFKEERRRQELTATTINIDIRTLKAMLENAIVWGYLKDNPFRPVKQIRQDRVPPRFLSKEEFSRLIGLMDNNELKQIVKFGALTGARRGEILNLQWKDIDFGENTITIQSSEHYRVKHGKSRIIPLPRGVRAVLSSADRVSVFVFVSSDGKQHHEDYVTKSFKAYARAAGLDEKVRFHTLRATAASWWAQAGATPFQIKELLGHAYVKTTEQYTRIPAAGLRNVVDSFSFDGDEVSGLFLRGKNAVPTFISTQEQFIEQRKELVLEN